MTRMLHRARYLPALTRRLAGDRRGVTLVLTALAAAVLLGFAGLAVDVGAWQTARLKMQGGADAAAYSAAVTALLVGPDPIVQAKGIAAQMGFVDQQSGARVYVNYPPQEGAYAGAGNNAYEVKIEQLQPMWFSTFFLSSAPTASARAVGRLQNGSKNCVYVLNPHASDSLHTEGAISSDCGIYVNSDNPTAAATLPAPGSLTSPSFSVVGGYTPPGSVTSPKINTGVSPAKDPLAYLVPPSYSAACDHTNYSVPPDPATLNPGTYCGGITISGSAHVTFNPGTYALLGGGLKASGTAVLSGTGVTFYNTFDATHPYAPITMADDVVVTLSAPTTGSMAGILFFEDRAAPASADNILMGSLTGVLYFRNTSLTLTSGSAVITPYTILVADKIKFYLNTFTIKADYSSLPGGLSPLQTAALVE